MSNNGNTILQEYINTLKNLVKQFFPDSKLLEGNYNFVQTIIIFLKKT
jgi:hypothetical protein